MSANYRTLHNLHAAAKAQFEFCADTVAYGEVEHWVSPAEIRDQLSKHGVLVGDCDDFASLCVMLARGQGMPARFVLCLTEGSESHLVCEIEGWILDNRQDDVARRDDLPYAWLAVSDFLAGGEWRLVEGGFSNA